MVYWIAWIFTLLLGYLIFRVVVRKDYLQHGALRLFAVFLEFVIFGLHANLPYLYLDVPWPQLPAPPENSFQLWSGLSISVLGLMLTLGFMAYLGFRTATGQQPGGLRQTGPYSWTRNPQLLTFGLMLVGASVLYPSIQTAAWLVLYAAIAHMMVITEEEYLQSLFEADYQDYCRRVPRYLINWERLFPSGTEESR